MRKKSAPRLRKVVR